MGALLNEWSLPMKRRDLCFGRGEALENERLVFLSTSSHGDGVRRQIEKTLEQRSRTFDAVLKQTPTIPDALSILSDGLGDIVAMSPADWTQYKSAEFSIIGLLPRREPTWVMVSEDKPEYLVKNAIIFCDHELLRRQLMRLRRDIVLQTSFEINLGDCDSGSREEIDALEELRLAEQIDGYVVKRSQYNLLSSKTRRHTLGLQRGSPERARFIPPPLDGFTLLVGRVGFPKSTVEHLLDPSAELSYRIESKILESIPDHLISITGVHVEQRGIGTILREAKRINDDWTMEAMIDPESNVKQAGKRLEMRIETLGLDGKVSASAERVGQIDGHRVSMINLLQEWGNMLSALTSPHEATNRRVYGLPDEFHEERPAMMDLHSDESE